MAQKSVPSTLIAPARAEFGQEPVPPGRLDPQRWCVTVGTAVSLGKEIVEEDGRENRAEYKESADDENPEDRIPHSAAPLQTLLHFDPRFDVGYVALDAFDDHVGTHR